MLLIVFLFRGQFFTMDMKNKLGEGAQGAVFRGLWHCENAAFKANEVVEVKSAMENVKEMQEQMREVYELIDLQKTAKKQALEAENQPNEEEQKIKKSKIDRVLFPLAHFRQITDQTTFDVYSYPLCKSDLSEYLVQQKDNVTGEIIKSICIQTTESYGFHDYIINVKIYQT